MNSSREDWLRSPRSMALLIATFVLTGCLATAFLMIENRAADAVRVEGDPLTDDQATAQVVESARQIVRVAALRDATGGYAFMSCRNADEPPYQVAVYMSFFVPQSDSAKYLKQVAALMTAHGWTVAPSADEHFGHKLTKDGVAAVFYANAPDSQFATLRLYGECRNTADHRNDNPVWTEITGGLG
jgi:hypothetical protein